MGMNMHKIQKLEVMPAFKLSVVFENGVEKIVDCMPYLNFPVFQPLKDGINFAAVRNCGYFIEWSDLEIYLSADTLWADGKIVG
jgi:hypothetical protein